MDKVERFLQQKGVDMIRIDGRTVMGTRHDLVARFQSVATCRVALLGAYTYLCIYLLDVYTCLCIYLLGAYTYLCIYLLGSYTY